MSIKKKKTDTLNFNLLERKRIKYITHIDLFGVFPLFRAGFSSESMELITFNRILLSPHFCF